MSSTYSHHFSHRNIPFGIATSGTRTEAQAVTRLHDSLVFLGDCQARGLFKDVVGLTDGVFKQRHLNDFAALSISTRRDVRNVLRRVFESCQGQLESAEVLTGCWEPESETQMHMPVTVGDFVGTFEHYLGYNF